MTFLLELAPPPKPWEADAACRDRNPEDFFRTEALEQRIVAAFCFEKCPVRLECLDWSIETCQRHGVWGGTTEKEREILIAGRRR